MPGAPMTLAITTFALSSPTNPRIDSMTLRAGSRPSSGATTAGTDSAHPLRRLRVAPGFDPLPGGGHSGSLFREGLSFGLNGPKSQLAAVPGPSATNLP